MASKIETINLILIALKNSFDVTADEADYFVGMQIERDRFNRKILIHQSKYIDSILHRFAMCDAQIVSVPADPHVTLEKCPNNDELHDIPYRKAVGLLLFVSLVSKPDVS